VDASIDALSDQSNLFPIRYGYAAVGTVIDCGENVDPSWLNQTVFAFNPHESHFCAQPEQLLVVPEETSAEDAAFLPNMETAVSFVQDSRPILGETVVVLGLGIVGQLTLALLSQMALGNLIGVDGLEQRRELALQNGATAVYGPDDPALAALDADLILELSGNPHALNTALLAAGYNGRILIGSWYGKKQAPIDLGGDFHRSNIQMIASQVSRLHPSLTGRWTKSRRMDVAWQMIRQLRPSERYITHQPNVLQAQAIYEMLDKRPEEALQVLFKY
ncbi:MAG: zinc-binding alcohol dehydrogenase, partial [Chloroflexota bacterium]